MGRSISFVDFDPVKGEEGEESFVGISLGSGDAWPCYWRLLMIAGYRRVVANGLDGVDDSIVEKIKDTILAVCPPSSNNVDNSNVPCGNITHLMMSQMGFSSQMGGIMSSLMGGGMLSAGRQFPGFDCQSMIDVSKLMKPENQIYLEIAGLGPMVDLYLFHNRNMGPAVIKRVASMMLFLREYMPNKSDLSYLDSPPYTVEEDEYNSGDSRLIELADAFIEASSHKYPIAQFY